MALTPSFLFDLESNMQTIQENEYARLTQDLWWPNLMRVRPSSSKRERISWLLSTAMIREVGKGGSIPFDDLVMLSTEYVNGRAAAGLKLQLDQLEDLDGEGVDLATKWSGDIGAYMAYYPQKQAAKAILNGENAKTYDGQNFFASAHPVNPFETAAGSFQNIFTGAASGAYPGACPIDESVTVDIALQNLGKIIAYIGTIKMPNGEDPRHLRARTLYVPPRLVPRAQQLTNAKFLAQAASGGAGSGDVEALIRNWGMAVPREVKEFSANATYTLSDNTQVSGSDTTFYVACEEISSSQLGALVYVNRRPFKVTYYTGEGGGNDVDAILNRADELEYHCKGRNVTGYGHPYLLFKCKGS